MLFCFCSCDFWMHSFKLGKMTVVDSKTATEVAGVLGREGEVGVQEGSGCISKLGFIPVLTKRRSLNNF